MSDKRIYAKAKHANSEGVNITENVTWEIKFPTGQEKGAWTCEYYQKVLSYGGFNYIRSKYDNKQHYTLIQGVEEGDEKLIYDGINCELRARLSKDTLYLIAKTWSENPPQTESLSFTLL